MTKQIRKGLVAVVSTLVLAMFFPATTYSDVAVSDVAEDQKSIIDEQEGLVTAGVNNALAENLVINEAEVLAIESALVSVKEEVEILSPYTEIIDNLTEEEKEILFKIVYAESGGQCIDGQRAVMEVIFNRILSEKFPNDLVSVLSSDGQFSTWRLVNVVSSNETQEEVLNLVYTEEPVLPSLDYIYFSTTQQSYANNYIQIQDHWFGTK